MSEVKTIFWRRLDEPGHEFATVARHLEGWQLTGVAVFAESGCPCRVEYEIRCDASWTTLRCELRGTIDTNAIRLDIERNSAGHWSVDGVETPMLNGCADIDLGFSPVTNLLPIRRLNLPIGNRAEARAAWVRFPALTLEVLEQSYERIATDRYIYESARGEFRRELIVDEFGCVVAYPGLWRAEATHTDTINRD